jgi:hypothetical protein
MLMDRYKIKYKIGKELSFNLQLSQADIDLVDYKESNDNLLSGTKQDTINIIEKGEIVKFSPEQSSSTLTFNFNGIYNYTAVGFDVAEINNMVDAYKKCNYIFQVYDSINSINQSLIHTGYLNGYNILTSGGTSIHNVSLSTESFNIYISKSFLETVSGNSFTLYFKIFLYVAKNGNLVPFTQNVTPLLAETQQYFAYSFNKSTRKYNFPIAESFKQLPSSAYTDIVNQSVDSIALQKTTFPSGNLFNVDGSYETI